tara:strand:- start:63377 stop:63943 length:567 start_codon:yes stop_codon:yes gene_type:complete
VTEFVLEPEAGVMPAARYIPTTNYNERPEGAVVSLIVVHSISLPPGEFGGDDIIKLFTNCLPPDGHPYYLGIVGTPVSAHLLIDRAGELTQFVPFEKRAWHAGVSEFQGQRECNDYSIGIELEGTGDVAYEDVQYQRLAKICAELMQQYPDITPERIVAHSDVAPGRKTDPGPTFDWQYFRQLLSKAD